MSDRIAISVKKVYKSFKLPHEKPSGLKQAIIKFKPGKKYEEQHVLDNISFDIKAGEFVGIVGRNGSGKSTLLKLLAQIYVPNSGIVAVNGSLTPFIELGVGFNAELTGRENVYLNGALLGFDRKQMDDIYDEIVEFAEIDRFMDQKLKNYSSGMQVRLAFSIAIRAKSDILLVDEVLAVGDAAFQQKCYNYFEELKRQKRTVVFVSHDMSAVQRFCSRAIYIDHGKLTIDSTPSEVADVYALENIESAQNSADNTPALSPNHSIKAKIVDEKAGTLKVVLNYSSKDTLDMFAGISILRDGISIAEINTLNSEIFSGDGELTYLLDTNIFNAGVYELTAALFRAQNKELVAATKRKSKFVVHGQDESRGAAMKLDDTWKNANSTEPVNE